MGTQTIMVAKINLISIVLVFYINLQCICCTDLESSKQMYLKRIGNEIQFWSSNKRDLTDKGMKANYSFKEKYVRFTELINRLSSNCTFNTCNPSFEYLHEYISMFEAMFRSLKENIDNQQCTQETIDLLRNIDDLTSGIQHDMLKLLYF